MTKTAIKIVREHMPTTTQEINDIWWQMVEHGIGASGLVVVVGQ